MQHLNTSLRTLRRGTELPCVNNVQFVFIRWRKPKELGTAKSKIFRVPPRPVLPIEEELELKRLFNNYRSETKSIVNYLTLKYNIKYQSSEDPEQVRKVFLEDFDRCVNINNKWNEEQKELREKRMTVEHQDQIEMAKRQIEVKLVEEIEQQEAVEEIVRKQKEVSKHFITPDKLDAAIEYAFANPVDFNFAIDLDGNKIEGRGTKSTKTKTEKATTPQ